MHATLVLEHTETMTAVVQEGRGSADVLHLRNVPIPAIDDDQMLIHVRSAAVAASDYHTIRGGWLVSAFGKILRQPPAHPIRGGELSGTVVAVGRNITTARPGDAVFGVGRGSWAQYAVGRERGIVTKPATLSFNEAAAIGGSAITALQALRDHGKMRPGQRVLVYGAGGGVGTFAVQLAKVLGGTVTAVTGPRNLDIVGTLGADTVLDYTVDDVAKRADRYDVVLDIAGIRPLGELIGLLAPGGTFVLVGAAKGLASSVVTRLVAALFRKRVLRQPVAIFVARINRDDMLVLRELAEGGRIRAVIDRTYPLAEIHEAVRYTLSGQGRAKVVIEVS